MPELNLPKYNPVISIREGKEYVFDPIRKKHLILTPEEWVRQHFINYLIVHLNYPRTLLKIEAGHTHNKLTKRSDIIVFTREGKAHILIECKRPEVKIDQNVYDQAASYNQKLKAKYLVVSNGLKHYCAIIDWEKEAYEILKRIPAFND